MMCFLKYPKINFQSLFSNSDYFAVEKKLFKLQTWNLQDL